ncbi:MAG: hypothetical protein LBI15_09780 [Dysgonamonadaceae bacterium]|jgi:hypothetical protein|nr:hypothetical protein [Dysgonamonadaceae bacterium]
MKKYFLLGFITLLLTSCGAKIYTHSAASDLIKNHKTIAIIPPQVSIAAQRNVDAASMMEQQRTESANFQREMYSWLLRRKQQGRLTVDIQSVDETIAKLTRAGFYEGQGAGMTPTELAQILGVDAVLTSNYSLSRPMSQGAAVAMAVLVGAFGPTARTDINLNLHDAATGTMFWNYSHRASGSFTSPAALVDNLMKHASKRLPYDRK